MVIHSDTRFEASGNGAHFAGMEAGIKPGKFTSKMLKRQMFASYNSATPAKVRLHDALLHIDWDVSAGVTFVNQIRVDNDGDVYYIGDSSGGGDTIWKLSGADGSLIWSDKIGTDNPDAFCVNPSTEVSYAISDHNDSAARYLANGTKDWGWTDISGDAAVPRAVATNASDDFFVGTFGGLVVKYDNTPAHQWSYDVDGRVRSLDTYSTTHVYVAHADSGTGKQLTCITTGGVKVWDYDCGALRAVGVKVNGAADRVYFVTTAGTNDHSVWAFTLAGALQWSAEAHDNNICFVDYWDGGDVMAYHSNRCYQYDSSGNVRHKNWPGSGFYEGRANRAYSTGGA